MKKIINSLTSHSVSRNSFSLFAIQIANYIIPLILLPFLTRTLGLDNYGILAIWMSAIQLSYVITDFGFSLSATYSISRHRQDRKYISNLIGAIYLLKAMLVVIAGTIMGVYWYSVEHEPRMLIFASIAMIFQAYQPIWLFQGVEDMGRITKYIVSTKFIYLVLVLLFVEGSNDGSIVIAFWAFVQALTAALLTYEIYRLGFKINKPAFVELTNVFREGAQFFWSRMAVALYTSANVLILGLFGSTNQVAIYSVCEQIYKAGKMSTYPINQALYPYMANKKNWPLFFKIVLAISLLMILFIFILIHYSDEILLILFDIASESAGDLLSLFIFLIFINYIGVSFGYPAFAAIGKVGIANGSVIAGAFLHLTILYSLYIFNEITALSLTIAIIITEFSIAISRVVILLKLRSRVLNE